MSKIVENLKSIDLSCEASKLIIPIIEEFPQLFLQVVEIPKGASLLRARPNYNYDKFYTRESLHYSPAISKNNYFKILNMTLVIAKKFPTGQVSLSSDSRISFGAEGHIDYGIKIFRVPVKVFSPIDSDTNIQTLVYNQVMGMAITGSAVNAYTIKESVFEIMQNLQYVPGYTNFSMEGFVKVVFKVYKKSTLELGTILRASGLSELILTGFCPDFGTFRTFIFTCDISSFPIEPHYREILCVPGIEFFGSGKSEGKRIYGIDPILSPLQILKKVILGQNVSTVGGGLQTGEFEEGDFKVYGVQDYSIDDEGHFKDYLYTLRGINLYKEEFESDIDGFHISYSFLLPFENEIKELFRSQNNLD